MVFDRELFEVYRREADIRDGLIDHVFGGAAVCIKRNIKIKADEQQEIFTQKLGSALRLTMGFANIYCDL